jgi:Zn-dependent peptidase ImmA (M78 family)
MRLPPRVTFPFGYVVEVRQVTDSEMLAEQEEDNREEVADGLWDVETRTIYVRKSLPLRRKRYILGHEVGHAFIDWQHFCLNEEAMRP